MKSKYIHYINLAYLMFMLVYPIVQKELFGFDGAGRAVIISTLSVFFLNIDIWTALPKISFLVPIWCIYVTINTLIHGVPSGENSLHIFLHSVYAPLIVMVIAYREFKYDFSLASTLCAISIILFAFIGAFFLRPVFEENTQTMRIMNNLGNDFPNQLYTAIIFISLIFSKQTSFRKILFFLAIIGVAAIIVMTATRKAFGAFYIVFLFAIITYILKYRIGLFKSLSIFACFVFLAYFISSQTDMGERQDSTLEKFDSSSSIFLKAVGDRSEQYVDGWEIFKENPLFGIGLNRYRKVSKSSEYRLHTEYMVQLTECGIIGALFFLLFNIGLLVHLAQCIIHKKRGLQDYLILFGALLSVLFLDFTSWTYDSISIHIVYGMILACIFMKRKQNQRISILTI